MLPSATNSTSSSSSDRDVESQTPTNTSVDDINHNAGIETHDKLISSTTADEQNNTAQHSTTNDIISEHDNTIAHHHDETQTNQSAARELLTHNSEFGVDHDKLIDANDKPTNGDHDSDEWGSHAESLLSIIGFAVGIGNIWRFPHVAYKYGGGSFLVPYILSMLFLGIPLVTLEMILGQTLRGGLMRSLSLIHPRLRGAGISAMMSNAFVMVYYAVLLAWSLLYMGHSLNDPLPWAQTSAQWNSTVEGLTNQTINGTSDSGWHGAGGGWGGSGDVRKPNVSAESFWLDDVLHMSASEVQMHLLVWPLFGTLLLSWVVVFFTVGGGVKVAGKVIYVTATVPLVILVILCACSLTLEGAFDGAKFLLVPNWDGLMQWEIWHAAAEQIFFSLGPGFGIVTALASHNPINRNSHGYHVVTDAIIVSVINSLASLLAGVAVFAILGHFSLIFEVPIDQVVRGGQGLIFVVIPQALTLLPVPQLFSFLFFLMLFLLGVDSQFTSTETLITAVTDANPRAKVLPVAVVVCFIGFAFGIFLVSDVGLYWFDVLDSSVLVYSLFMNAFVECIAVAYTPVGARVLATFAATSGQEVPQLMFIIWRYCCPVLLLFLLGIAVINDVDGSRDRPLVSGTFAHVVSLLPLFPVIVCLVFPDVTACCRRCCCRGSGCCCDDDSGGTLLGDEADVYGNGHTGIGGLGDDDNTFDEDGEPSDLTVLHSKKPNKRVRFSVTRRRQKEKGYTAFEDNGVDGLGVSGGEIDLTPIQPSNADSFGENDDEKEPVDLGLDFARSGRNKYIARSHGLSSMDSA